jgi:hypothetical protein
MQNRNVDYTPRQHREWPIISSYESRKGFLRPVSNFANQLSSNLTELVPPFFFKLIMSLCNVHHYYKAYI